MDPIQNPYSPGAGTPPPELAGRDDIFEQAQIAMERHRRGRPARGILMVGLRGVGKTVLLEKIHENAVSKNLYTLRIEAPEERSLPAFLASQLRITLIGAGLPQLRGRTGRAKSYAERLFEFPNVGALDEESAKAAIVRPAEEENVTYAADAVAEIIRKTEGYPYFLQEWGKHSWDCATQSPITLTDVRKASDIAVAALDDSFFRVRLDRLRPFETIYLRAMADLGPGPHRSGDIAKRLDRAVSSVAPTRGNLIKSGVIWSPNHGDTAFTVPLFDQFMRRKMPGNEWEGD